MTTQLMQAPQAPVEKNPVSLLHSAHVADYIQYKEDNVPCWYADEECEDLDFMQELIDEPVQQYAPVQSKPLYPAYVDPKPVELDMYVAHINAHIEHRLKMSSNQHYAAKYGDYRAHVSAYYEHVVGELWGDDIPF